MLLFAWTLGASSFAPIHREVMVGRADTGADFPETADIETASDDYASRFSGKVGAWLLQVQEAATLHLLEPHVGARVLDVGGGHGQLTPLLVSHGFDVTVTGSSDSCRKRIQEFIDRGQVTYRVANVLALPFDDRSFDVVVSYRLLSHVNRWKEFLAELARVADTSVIIDFPSVWSVNYVAPQLFKMKKRIEGNTRPFVSYRESDLNRALEPLQFAPAGRYAQFFVPMALHRLLKAPRVSAVVESVCRSIGLTRLFGSPVALKLTRSERGTVRHLYADPYLRADTVEER